jgi:hypothetical protein
MLLKFLTSEDYHATLQGRKGLAGTKLSLDEDLTPTQQACKSELWPLFKEAKATTKRTFWHVAKFFVNNTQIYPPSSKGVGTKKTYAWYYGTCTGGSVNKLKMKVQIFELFQGVDLVLLTETWHFPGQHLPHVEGFTSFAIVRIMQLGKINAIKHSEGVVAHFCSHLNPNLSQWKEGSHDGVCWPCWFQT